MHRMLAGMLLVALPQDRSAPPIEARHHPDALQFLLQMNEIPKEEGWTMLHLLLNVSGWQEAAAGTLVHGLEILAVECGR